MVVQGSCFLLIRSSGHGWLGAFGCVRASSFGELRGLARCGGTPAAGPGSARLRRGSCRPLEPGPGLQLAGTVMPAHEVHVGPAAQKPGGSGAGPETGAERGLTCSHTVGARGNHNRRLGLDCAPVCTSDGSREGGARKCDKCVAVAEIRLAHVPPGRDEPCPRV